MKISRKYLLFGIVLAAFSLVACQPADEPAEPAEPAESVDDDAAAEQQAEPAPAEPAEPAQANVVEVTAIDYAFQAPSSIPSGWTTFELTNAGEQEHFLLLWRLPEGRTFDEWMGSVARPFSEEVDRYEAGEFDREGLFEALGESLPEWFFTAESAGGVGLITPGGSARTSVNLAPGNYAMECYVRSPDGDFHGELGMVRPLTVTAEDTGAPEPDADIRMTVSNYELVVDGEFGPGPQTVRVDVVDEPEGMLSHDVHLVRLDNEDSLDKAIEWMDWVDAMYAPAPVTFLGGVEDMPAGNTAYVNVDLEPGDYAWISELYSDRGVVNTFSVD